jgi:amino acid adenylation domain-containing protein
MAYNMPAALHLDGPLDKPALQNALQTLLQRHTLLRSVIDHSQGLPHWHVQSADSIMLEEINCSHDAAQTWLQDTINTEAQQPFNIDGQVLLRIKLLTLAPQQHVLLLTLHHLLGDAQSLLIIARELATLYTAFHHQQANPLPAPPLQFSDYSYWQQDLLRSELIREQLAYWVSELDQAPPLLGLPLDRPRPALQTFHGAQLAFSIDADLTEKLQALARNHGVTLFMLLLASYQLLLSQLCQQRDVCVGIPRDGRTLRELEPMIGFFINALVIRTRLDANYSLSELLLKVRDKTLLAFANELVPAEQVMQALHIERQLQFMPIVQAAFNYLNADEVPSTFNLDGLQVGFIEQEIVSAKFECLLTVVDYGKQLQAGFEYNTDLFDIASIERFRDSWLYLLEQITHHPDAHINQLHLPGQLPADEIISLQGEPAIENSDFMQAITAQATSHPDAMAVICGNKHLSYAELECAANAVAHHLLAQGVQQGDRVAILMANRVELLPAILGAVKAGACYVPMDVNYPAGRLRHILMDAAPAVLITEQDFQQQFYPGSDFTDFSFMDIDTLDLSATTAPVNAKHVDLDLLYMIYTSGSTGLPKGASVYYRSESNLLAWYTKEFGFNAADKTLVMSALGFDLTQKNLFALLTVGGTVVLSETGYYDVHSLLHTIEQHGITTLNCAPSAFYPLVDACDAQALQKLRSLRTVLLGGEPVQLKRLSAWVNAPAFNCSMVNMYGPTECTDISAFHTLAPEQLKTLFAAGQANEFIFPLGKPCAGVSLYILNEQLQPLANGLAGELCISGINLGAGYWQQAELTASTFVPNPFAKGEHDALLYRSGDLVRLDRDDGLLYYLGRKDFQLKLRGLRIEPGEIEQVLRSLPAILDAVVLLDDGQLLAFVLTDEQHKTDGLTGWREYLLNRLPDYMVPNLLIPVSTWPLTPNGKIDRQALLVLPRPPSAALYVAPRTATEEDIAQYWQDILGINKAGVFDNFFESGGDSLAALRLLAALEKHFNTRLPVASLFGAQTIAQLALAINNRLSDWSPIVPIQPQGNKIPVFAVDALGAMVSAYEPLARALGKDQPFYGIQAPGFEEDQTPYSDLNTLLECYIAAIRQQQPHGPYQIIGHSFGGLLAIELARKLQQQGETVKFVGLLDTHMPGRYTEMAVDDAQIIAMINEQFHGLLSEDFTRRAIAVVRGLQTMISGFRMQPLDTIPLLLFTPQDWSAKLLGVALNISQLRNIKTRGFEKISKNVTVISVPGDHYSMLNVTVGDILPITLQETAGTL